MLEVNYMNKRGAELSLNVIIIAALALLVLVIVAIIFMGRTGMFRKESGNCVNMGGYCSTKACNGDYERRVSYDCNLDGDTNLNEGQTIDGVCCIAA
jgi:hypothetical protein